MTRRYIRAPSAVGRVLGGLPPGVTRRQPARYHDPSVGPRARDPHRALPLPRATWLHRLGNGHVHLLPEAAAVRTPAPRVRKERRYTLRGELGGDGTTGQVGALHHRGPPTEPRSGNCPATAR